MSIPGFTAERSLSGATVTYKSLLRSNPTNSRQLIPALPVEGGMGCLALANSCLNCLHLPNSTWQTCLACQGVPNCYPKGVPGLPVNPDPWCVVPCGGNRYCMEHFC